MMKLTQLYSALARVNPVKLDATVSMGMAFMPDDDVDLVGLTPIRAMALAYAHPDIAGVQADVRLERLVGQAWSWLVGSDSRRMRGSLFGMVGADEARDAAHDDVRTALLLMTLASPFDSQLQRPRATESALRTLRNRESGRIEHAGMLRTLVTGPVSLEVLGSLSEPDAGILLNISDAGVAQLELVLQHFTDLGAYVWQWAHRAVLAGVGESEQWRLVMDGLVPAGSFTDSGPDMTDQALNIEQLRRTLVQLEHLVIERRVRPRSESRGLARIKPMPLCTPASRRFGRMLS
jgi:hypothetical protein